jgi:hypothetical protein
LGADDSEDRDAIQAHLALFLNSSNSGLLRLPDRVGRTNLRLD